MRKIIFISIMMAFAGTAIAQLYIPPGKTIYINGSSLYVNGSISDSGSITGNGYLVVNGNTVQNITGNGIVQKMVLSNIAGAAMNNSTLNIPDSLFLQQGILTLGNNNITAGRTSAGSSSSYIRTNGTGVLKQNTAAADVVFPVGNTSFDPVTLSNSGTADVLSVRVADDVLSGGTTGTTVTNPVIKRTWHISEAVAGGSNITMKLQWNSGEEINSFNNSHVYIAHHNGTSWENYGINPATAPAATGSNPYTVTKAGITSLSPFAVASSGASPLGGAPCTQAPGKPGNFTQSGGAVKVCPTETRTYSVNPVNGAGYYNWVTPNGAIIQSGQGSNSIVVLFTTQFPLSASITVTAVNNCGVSPVATKTVNKNSAPSLSAIAGKNYGVCDLVGEAYSVTLIEGAVYNWTSTSPNATIVSGQGSNAVVVNFAHPYATGKIQVKGTNGCGTSSLKSLTVKSVPNKPAAINGPLSVCSAQANVPYSIDPVYAAETYTWIAPSGSHISDGITISPGTTLVTASTSVTINFGTTAGTVKVRGSNDCGNGGYKAIQVAFNCREHISANAYCNLFPNPSHDQLNILFQAPQQEKYTLRVIDALGKEVLNQTHEATEGSNEQQLSVSGYAAGVYQLLISSANMNYRERFVVD